MDYQLIYYPDVFKIDIPKLPSNIKDRIRIAIEERLSKYPVDVGVPLRHSLKGHWKFRVGDYRIIYRISAEKIIILIIGHQKEAYFKIFRRLK